MKRLQPVKQYLCVALTVCGISCGPTSFEESFVYRDPAEITNFSVPDSAESASIPVTIEAILGTTTASSLESIEWGLSDSLFTFGVFARREEKHGVQYEPKDILLDTTFVLTLDPPRTGLHYFTISSSSGPIFVDSAVLY